MQPKQGLVFRAQAADQFMSEMTYYQATIWQISDPLSGERARSLPVLLDPSFRGNIFYRV
jgi:hypothetical protein